MPSGNAPPSWKQFLLTWLAAFPTLLVVSTLVGPAGLPEVLALAITSCALTALLTWVILPRVTRRARRWLYRDAQPASQALGYPGRRDGDDGSATLLPSPDAPPDVPTLWLQNCAGPKDVLADPEGNEFCLLDHETRHG